MITPSRLSTRMGRCLGLASCFLSLALAAQTTGDGTVTGRVVNAGSGAYLEGAEVSIGERHSVLTDRNGNFILDRVPPGPQQVRVFYTGLEITSTSVDVRPGQTATLEVALKSSLVTLEAFQVSGEREGNAASLTKQRLADNVKNVVSLDTFGNVADGNIGNFLARLPGVAGEDPINSDIVGIKIRGSPADLTSVNFDGVRTAGAIAGFSAMGDRATFTDQFPAESIKEAEVIKAPTPDMPADAIGGSVNLVSKSALDYRESVLTYRVGGNYNTFRDSLGRVTPLGMMTYLTRLGPRRAIGMAVSLSYADTETPRDRVQTQRAEEGPKATQARTYDEVNTRVRAGTALRFDYRIPDANTDVYVKFKYDYYRLEGMIQSQQATVAGARRVADYSRVSRAQIEAGTPARASDNQTAGVAPAFNETFTEMLSATWLNEVQHNQKLGRNFLGQLGGTKKFGGGQSLEFQATYNPSWFDASLPTFRISLRPTIGMSIDTRENRSRPVFTQTYGPSLGFGSDLNLYNGTFNYSPQRTEEEVTAGKADYVKDFGDSRRGVQFKSGVNWRQQHRRVRSASPSWNFTGVDRVAGPTAAGINDDNLAQFRSPEPAYGVFNNQYPRRDKIDILAVERAMIAHPEWFGATASVTAPPSISEITEDVYAAYAQARLKTGPLNVLGGVRFEQTELDASGRYSDSRNPTVTSVKRKSDYDGIFPSLHFRYTFRPRLIGRASVSTGAARPNMADLYPTTTVTYDATGADGTVSQNAVGLRPQRSTNYDLSLEYYLEPGGIISAGVFRKDIKNFLVRSMRDIGTGADNGFGGQFANFTLSSTSNGGKAKVDGIEINYSQQLTMLPRPFNGLQIFANHTNLRTSGEYEEGTAELAGFVPKITNAGMAYRWRAFETRLSYRYMSSYMRNYSADRFARNRLRPIEKYDLSFQYRIRPQLTVFVDVINLFNKWGENYTGDDRGRITVADVYGRRLSGGISGRF